MALCRDLSCLSIDWPTGTRDLAVNTPRNSMARVALGCQQAHAPDTRQTALSRWPGGVEFHARRCVRGCIREGTHAFVGRYMRDVIKNIGPIMNAVKVA